MFLTVLLSVVVVASGQEYKLVWSDEFNGTEIDPNKWEHEVTAWGGGNGEFQVYTPMPENSWVNDGFLHLKPTLLVDNINPETGEPFGGDFLLNGEMDLLDMFGSCSVGENNGCKRTGTNDNSAPGIPPIASARLRTAGRFSYLFGRVEIRAKMPVGDWLWPAMWLLPEDWVYGEWPISGEIDIVETIGNRNYVCEDEDGTVLRDIRHMGVAMHWGVNGNQNRFYLTNDGRDEEYDSNYGDYFHEYSLDWDEQGFRFLVDDILVMQVPDPPIMDRNSENCWTGFYDFGAPWQGPPQSPWTEDKTCVHYLAPFDQSFHFLFNVAVGGTNWFIPDGCVNRDGEEGFEKPWQNGGGQEPAMWHFYDKREFWYDETWVTEGDKLEMMIDYIRVYQRDDYENTETPDDCPAPPESGSCPDDDGGSHH